MLHSVFPNFEARGVRGKLAFAMKFAGTAVGLVILFWYRNLFFCAPRVIRTTSVMNKAVDIPFENARSFIFFFLIALLAFSCLDGLRAAYGRGTGTKRHAFSNPLTMLASLALIFGNAVLSFYEIELINNYYIARMEPKYVWLNIWITFVLYLVIVFLTNSLPTGMRIGNVFFLCWGIANYFVQSFRGSPFQWVDLYSIRTASNVAGNYRYNPNWEVVACTVLTFAVFGFYGHFHLACNFRRIPLKVLSRGIAVALFAAFYIVIFRTDYLSSTGIWLRDWQPWYTYRLFGMESGFLAFAKNSMPKEPDTYSSDKVKSIISTSEKKNASLGQDASLVQPENIICIMDEAFSDLTVYPNFRADTDLMPTIDSLKEDTQSGHLLVSVKGGTTANTEYEFLTGNSCALSPSTVVYTSFIKDNQYSLARTLKAQGYRAVAMHPYLASGWSRTLVYPRMGFDEFLSLDNSSSFAGADTVRGFVSDQADFESVIDQVKNKKKGEKLFLFNVTMQNHSSYNDPTLTSTAHTVGYSGMYKSQADQYLTLVTMTDQAVQTLIDYFSRSDEKTLICFWGDHQPEIGDDFWEYCLGKDQSSLNFDEQQLEYQSKFFIWANYDIPEKQDQLLSANDLSSYLLSLTGLQMTGYNRYLLGQMKSIPAMNAYGYLGTDGRMHEWNTDDVGSGESEEFENYKCLIYNELTAGHSRDSGFFGLTDAGG